MPEKLQPGPLAGEISLFAPVSLFFFFFLVFIITLLRGIHLHPMNYFFLAAAFSPSIRCRPTHLSIHVSFILALFSYAFLFKGFTGLAVTLGSILTLFAVMQMTGRIRWSERFQGAPGVRT